MTLPAVDPPPTPLHPLLADLVAVHGATRVTRDTVDDWEAEPGTTALLFAGDPAQVATALDMATALPRLQAAFHHRFRIGVVAPGDEDMLAGRYGRPHRPTLVFLRDGGWLGNVPGGQDWPGYVTAVGHVLAQAAVAPPGGTVPIGSGARHRADPATDGP
jgi:hydrogenase-1 operon protein HyaE